MPRRNPRYPAFLLTGAAVGVLAAVVLVLGPGADVADRARLLSTSRRCSAGWARWPAAWSRSCSKAGGADRIRDPAAP